MELCTELRTSPTRSARFARQVCLLLGLLGSCASSGESALAPEFAPADFTLVLLADGDRPQAATEDLSQRHLTFIQKLAAEKSLLIAGAFGPERYRSELRGMFIMDEADPARAQELAGEDPPTQAGVFRQEVIPLITLDVIRYLPRVEKVRQERRLSNGESVEQPDIRAYTVLVAPDGTTVADQVFSQPSIAEVTVLMARMGGERAGELFAILDVPTAEEVRARLRIANAGALEIQLAEWYSSPSLAELVRGGGPSPEMIEAERAQRRLAGR